MIPAPVEVCVTCDHEIASPYCPNCGEQRASDRSLSIWDFLRQEVVASVTSFDGRMVRTLRTLVTKPGELTAAFVRGARLPYLAPLQCFLLCNLVFFVWSAAVGMRIFDTPLAVHTTGMPYSGVASRLVAERIAASRMDPKLFEVRFDTVGAAQARSLVVAMVPLFAVLVALVTLRRGRQRPVAQHLVFGLHIYAFMFVLLVFSVYVVGVPLSMLLRALHVPEGRFGYDAEVSTVQLTLLAGYIAMALRRAYDVSRRRATLSALVLAFGWGIIVQAYRGLLFFVTLYSM